MANTSEVHISNTELKHIIKKGGKNQFYTGWNFYSESPYAYAARQEQYWNKEKFAENRSKHE